jgi:hypothetical protein
MPKRYVIALLVATLCATPAAGALLAASDGSSGETTGKAEAASVARKRDRQAPVYRPFARSSFWNSPLADSAPLDKRSDGYVRRLNELLNRWDPYVNTVRWSTPVYTVGIDQRRVQVKLDNTQESLREAFESVPIPRRARASRGHDHHMVVWQPITDTMWEFWVARRLSDGWHARYGGKMEGVSRNPGYFTDPNPRWGATATSLPLLGGLMRLEELEAGRIDHGLAIALPEIKADVFSWPAQRTDGSSHHVNAIPAGTRFRIDPSLDLDSLEMSPIVRVMARAVQRYGMVVRDGGGAVAFYAEDPTPTNSNPFLGPDGLFGGGYISNKLRAEFPWEHLQALKTDLTDTPGFGVLGG